jgi:uncharacterized protein YhaN
MRAAEQAWLTRLSNLPCASKVQESLLQSLDPLRALRKHSDDYHHTAQRVEAMQQDQTQFREALNALCKTHNLPMENSAADTFLNLRAVSRQARDTESKAFHLTEKLERAIADHDTTKQELDRLYNRLKTYGSIFPAGVAVNSLETLRKAAIVTKQVINDRSECQQLEREVLEEMEVDSVAQARDILDNASDSDLLVEEEDNKVALTAAEKQLEQAIEARTLAEKALSDISGDAEIATLNERRAAIELKMEDTATHYLTLTLGHTLADTAIKRYRDSHRSDMMSATERCFAALTNNAYPQLTTQPEAGKEILLAVNKEGTSKQVDALSKGTRFQLYLALRAAAYEQLINQGTSLPFFCDDIFETFDETRTSAACQVMEQIGTKGQAIYLTHHQHVVDIAKQVCNSPPQVHNI